MTATMTAAGKKDIADNGFGGSTWYAFLHSSAGSAEPTNGTKMAKGSVTLNNASWEIGSETNPTARPSADLTFMASAADATAGSVPQTLAFWDGTNLATATLMAYGDIYLAGGTNRLAGVAEEDQSIVIAHDAVVFTLS